MTFHAGVHRRDPECVHQKVITSTLAALGLGREVVEVADQVCHLAADQVHHLIQNVAEVMIELSCQTVGHQSADCDRLTTTINVELSQRC